MKILVRILVLGFHGNILVVRVEGMASLRSCLKLPWCPTKPVPASSRMAPLLAKLEPIGDVGSASVKTHLRRGKTVLQQQPEERSENL